MDTSAQSLASSITSTNNRRPSPKAMNCNSDTFPAGLRVLVVDDDPICLLILDRMLRHCQYQVTTCGKATEALAMLRENRNSFDVIISDVCMPDMDGFKLLELVGLEMDLPVIMMSANGETSAVMKGIKHGACDYLLKPVRIEELRNIWQHVVRRKWRNSGQSCISEDDKARQVPDDSDHYSSANESMDGSWNRGKKRKDTREEEDDVELDNDDPSTTKKPRVVWSVDLHQQFVNAVNQLGIDKAVPKRILELMNVQGLTRENVASHLQKYRLYLKRISGGAGHQAGVMNPPFPAADLNFGSVSATTLARLNELRALTGPGQLSSQALLSTLQTEILGRLGSGNNLGIGNLDPSILMQLALQSAGNGGLTRSSTMTSYSQPSINNQSAFQPVISDAQAASLVSFPGSVDKGPSGLSLQQQLAANQSSLGGIGQLPAVNNSIQQVNPSSNSLLMQALQQQQTSKTAMAISTSGIVTKPGLSETSAWPSNVNSSSIMTTQHSSMSLRQGPVSSAAGNSSVPNVLRHIGRTTDADIQGLQKCSAGHAIVQNSSAISLPLVSSGLNGSSSLVLSNGATNPESKFKLHPGVKQDQVPYTGRKSQGTWQGFGMSQDHGQVSNGQACLSSGAQALTSSAGQEQNQSCNSGFDGPSNNSLGDGCLKAFQNDDFRVENSLRVKEEGDEWLPEHVSDELLSIVLKQVRS